MRSFLLLFLIFVLPAAALSKEKPPIVHRIPLPPRPDFSALDWLLGEWSGKTDEKSPKGELSLTVSYDLDQRYMVFREQISLAATPNLPETKETWLGIMISERSGGYTLRLFSDTGFITRYRVTVEGGNITLSPEGGEQPPPGWLFRRLYQRADVNAIAETVQVAPPDKPFFEYYSARLTRKAAPQAPVPPPNK
jgi:hypothetical protein